MIYIVHFTFLYISLYYVIKLNLIFQSNVAWRPKSCLDTWARTFGILWFDRVVVTTLWNFGTVVEVTTASVIGLLVVNFTTATDLSVGIVDLVATVYRNKKVKVRTAAMQNVWRKKYYGQCFWIKKSIIQFYADLPANARLLFTGELDILTEVWAVWEMIFTVPDTTRSTRTITDKQWWIKTFCISHKAKESSVIL